MFRVRTRSVAVSIRNDMTHAMFYLGLLLSTLGAFGFEHSASISDATALPAIPGALLLIMWAYRVGLIRR
ncbi:MAG: hypothetical protein DI585_03405 [Pseudomonas fluorescens]|nr:MAG: hypothetical protein DI585_03405 [Pseudomonas fluorescens]